MLTREALHRLVDELPEESLDEAGKWLAELAEPLYTLETAPFDDEPLSDEEQALLDERWESYKAGNFVTHDEVVRMFRELASHPLGD